MSRIDQTQKPIMISTIYTGLSQFHRFSIACGALLTLGLAFLTLSRLRLWIERLARHKTFAIDAKRCRQLAILTLLGQRDLVRRCTIIRCVFRLITRIVTFFSLFFLHSI
jgi:hypothetical protein